MKTLFALGLLLAPFGALAANTDRMMQDATQDAITHYDKSDVGRYRQGAAATQRTTTVTTTTTTYPAPDHPPSAYAVPTR